MSSQSYSPYRGCHVDVHVTATKLHALGGFHRRFRVRWTILSPGLTSAVAASFPEQFDFLNEQDAFSYGEKRAHVYIDSILSTPCLEQDA
ncbi:hypothetical protein [Paraburkholderia terrae]|uniref:hypothetical protein n=1 Tax=Paraburkholderia terrae TaxID=311230 RepID=UPI001EE39D7E|nr:hypothetical protein [Paraburkholderia terrae]GJH04561.1 hypothetical protein CBA19C8_28410 [Paraburkholderia terrae]